MFYFFSFSFCLNADLDMPWTFIPYVDYVVFFIKSLFLWRFSVTWVCHATSAASSESAIWWFVKWWEPTRHVSHGMLACTYRILFFQFQSFLMMVYYDIYLFMYVLTAYVIPRWLLLLGNLLYCRTSTNSMLCICLLHFYHQITLYDVFLSPYLLSDINHYGRKSDILKLLFFFLSKCTWS